jgi:hypothetical protein
VPGGDAPLREIVQGVHPGAIAMRLSSEESLPLEGEELIHTELPRSPAIPTLSRANEDVRLIDTTYVRLLS